MFKSLLAKGMQDILVIFNSTPALPMSEVQDRIDEANAIAEPLWNDPTASLQTRRDQCRQILVPVLNQNLTVPASWIAGTPSNISADLTRVFRRHYSHEKLLLIGGNSKEAYEVQDRYARDVALLLGSVRHRWGSRAISCLAMAYGRNTIPLLCMSSVSALWRLCSSPFYKRQLSLVSSVCLLPHPSPY